MTRTSQSARHSVRTRSAALRYGPRKLFQAHYRRPRLGRAGRRDRSYFSLAAPVRRRPVIGGQLTDRLYLDCPGPSGHVSIIRRRSGVIRGSLGSSADRAVYSQLARSDTLSRFASRSPPSAKPFSSIDSVLFCGSWVSARRCYGGLAVHCRAPGPCVITSAGAQLGANSVGIIECVQPNRNSGISRLPSELDG
jgi:hypothetical protein